MSSSMEYRYLRDLERQRNAYMDDGPDDNDFTFFVIFAMTIFSIFVYLMITI